MTWRDLWRLTLGDQRGFGGGAPSAPPPPPPPPSREDTDVKTAAADERRRLRARKGRTTTMLTDPSLVNPSDATGVQKATLLGGGG